MAPEHHETVEHAAPPPLVFAGALGLGILLDRIHHVPFVPTVFAPLRRIAGVLSVVAGMAVALWSLLAMRRVGVNPSPHAAPPALAVGGPYRFSRNPIYVGMTLFYLGGGLLRNAGWAPLLLPGVLMFLRRGVIEREELYLTRRFGDDYLRYAARVRRWL